MTLVVNLYGGPGTGKSTLAYELTGLLKRNNYNAELVVEYVKHSTYAQAQQELSDQIFLVAQHNHRIKILNGTVDFIITDASLLNTFAYTKPNELIERNLAVALYERYNNIGFVLPRKQNYVQVGRIQTEEEAIALDKIIHDNILWLPEKERIDLRDIPCENLVQHVYDTLVSEHVRQTTT